MTITTSYLTSIDTFSLSRTVFEIFDFKVFRVWPFWPSEVTKGQKYFDLYRSPEVEKKLKATSYLTSIDSCSLSRFSRYSTWKISRHDLDLWLPKSIWIILSFLRSSRFWGLNLWPLKVTWGHKYTFVNITKAHTYMTSYLTSIDTFSLSRTVFEIFEFKVSKIFFRVWPHWPYWPFIDRLTVPFSVKKVFDLDLWL